MRVSAGVRVRVRVRVRVFEVPHVHSFARNVRTVVGSLGQLNAHKVVEAVRLVKVVVLELPHLVHDTGHGALGAFLQ